jgi:hypothetical protein
VEQCKAACAVNDNCEAYAFRTSKPVCYVYSHVYMGRTPPQSGTGHIQFGVIDCPEQRLCVGVQENCLSPAARFRATSRVSLDGISDGNGAVILKGAPLIAKNGDSGN